MGQEEVLLLVPYPGEGFVVDGSFWPRGRVCPIGGGIRTRLEELATDFQKIKERALVLPQETVDLRGVARGVAERKGKTLGALFDEVFRRIVNEQELAGEARSSESENLPIIEPQRKTAFNLTDEEEPERG